VFETQSNKTENMFEKCQTCVQGQGVIQKVLELVIFVRNMTP